MKIYKIALLFLVLISTISCKKFLDIKSQSEQDEDEVFTTVDGLRNARIGMYSSLQSRDYYGGVYPLLAEAYSDNGSTGGYDVSDLDSIKNRNVIPNNLYIKGISVAIYHSIYTANKILENADKIAGVDETELKNIKGEAYFVRALAEFDLLRMFGQHWDLTSPYGISIKTTTANPTQIIARSSVQATYNQIIDDLKQAESLNIVNKEPFKCQYVSSYAIKALLARVYLYTKDFEKASAYASEVIANSVDFVLLGSSNLDKIYTTKNTKESIFELKFTSQNQSFYNGFTYSRSDALRSDVQFLASENLKTFFESRTNDFRANFVDYVDVDVSIQPDGRTQKYRGEETRDNAAYILRLAEMYLIRAEALGLAGGGLTDLNLIRENRGMAPILIADVPDNAAFAQAIADERRAELNFESSRLFDLARTQTVESVLGASVNPIMPIPLNDIMLGNGIIKQNPGY